LGRALATQASKDGMMSAEDYQWMLDNMIGDDTGDNISLLNREFCELTAIYWAWKNYDKLGNPDYIGLMHYRRQFIFNDAKQDCFFSYPFFAPQSQYRIPYLTDRNINDLFSENEIISAVSEADVLVTKAVTYNFSVYEQYAAHKREHVLSDLDDILSIITEKYSEYSESAKKYKNSHQHYFFNMFVMKRDIFETYCQFLFGSLFELKKRINIMDRSIVKQRCYAFLAERITGIFITQLQKDKSISIKEKWSIFEDCTDIPQEIKPAFRENNIPVVFSSDDNYIPYLAVALKSLICNTTSDKNYDIFIIDEHIKEHNKKSILQLIPENATNISIRFIDIKPYLRDIDESIFYCHWHFSISTYYRFFIPRILKNFDKAVYLDCDIVVLSDIAKLYDINLSSYLLGAIKDVKVIHDLQKDASCYQVKMSYFTQKLGMKNPNNYFQAGVLLMDLTKMRREDFESKCIAKLFEIKTPDYVDQDILNSLYENQVKFLPLNWNIEWHLPIDFPNLIEEFPAELYSDYLINYTNPSIIHYCSLHKPWKEPRLALADYWWHYARMTPFYEEILYKNIKQSQPQSQPNITREMLGNIFNYTKIKHKYWRYKILSKITFGKKRKKYKQKKKDMKARLKEVKKFLKGK
jgi:lipopolysaccharide biosynthesis glycosyltransferase